MSWRPFDLERICANLAFGPSRDRLYQDVLNTPAQPLVIQAPPGSGKTTIVPPTVANALEAAEFPGRVIVTQPRRVAARAAARRLAQLDGSPLGDRIGYAVRGERKASADTKIEFVTAGLLLRRLLTDPDLQGVGAVIIDEAHERSLDTDLLLAMVNQVSELREDLAFVLMSATLQTDELANLLTRDHPATVLSADSAQFEVTELFDSYPGTRMTDRGLSDDYLRHVARSAGHHARQVNRDATHPVDTLVFVPGVREVSRVCRFLESDGHHALALHAQIGSREQDAILSEPAPGSPPRIIVSTSIAESSLTVPRVHLVIDAGYAREPRRDAGRGFSGLVTVVASRAAATQRAGRAGRLGPGTVVRTLDTKSFAAAPAQSTPEIRTGDLVGAGLALAAWGTPRGEGLRMWEAPPASAMSTDEQTLRDLEAVDEQGQITELGQRIAAIPADPRIARALLDGSRHYGGRATAQAAALLSGSDRIASADLAELLTELRRSSHPGHHTWQREAVRLERLTPGTAGGSGQADAGVLAGVCALAFPHWVARRVTADQYLLASGTRAELPRGSQLAHHEYLAVAEVARTGNRAMIRRAVGADLNTLGELLPHMLRTRTESSWLDGRVSARRVEYFGNIELASHPVPVTAELGLQAAGIALSERGLGLFGPQPTFDALRRRLAVAYRLLGDPFVAVDEPTLVRQSEHWLEGPLRQLASGVNAARIDLAGALRALIPWEHAHDFDTLVPERLQVPSGSRIAIEYPPVDEDGPAVVSVKLQECFGLDTSPRLVRGLLPVQFHLLSPAGRPLAVTEDLVSFFNGPYKQVRAEMRGRYPKHPWPENPWEHVATAATSNRLRREQGKGH